MTNSTGAQPATSADGASAAIDEDAYYRALGERVHSLIWQRRISQAAIARQLGLDKSSFGRRIRASVKFQPHELVQIARILDVPLAELCAVGPLSREDGRSQFGCPVTPDSRIAPLTMRSPQGRGYRRNGGLDHGTNRVVAIGAKRAKADPARAQFTASLQVRR